MTIKENNQSPAFGLTANTGGKLNPGAIESPKNTGDEDDLIHQQEENLSSVKLQNEDPDELVHRMNVFKPGTSLTTDMDDEMHQKYQEEDMDDH